MRSFLGFVVFVGLLVALLVIVAIPLVARPLVAALVRDALPFGDQPVQVAVDVGPALLVGNVDRIGVSGESLTTGGGAIQALDVEVTGFSVVDRSFEAIDGRLSGLVLRLDDGTTVTVGTVELAGPDEAVTATARLDGAGTERLVRARLAEGGIVPDRVVLGPATIRIESAGFAVDAELDTIGGSLWLTPQQSLPRVRVIEVGDDDPWRLTSARVSPDGLVVEARIDAARLLAG